MKNNSWPPVRFGDVVREVRETENDPLRAGFERYVGLEHLDPESLHIKRWGQIADSDITFTRVFRAGQVLFGRRRAYQRKAAVADFDGICSGDIIVMEAREEHLLPDLLPFIVQTEGFYDYALRTSAGSLSPRTKWSHLAAYEFALPPEDEQRRIADILWAADAEKEALLNVQLKLHQLAVSVGSEAFQESQPCILLGELVKRDELSFQTGPFGTVLKASSYVEQGIPIINPVNMADGKLVVSEGPFISVEDAERLSKYRMEWGDIVLGRKGDVGRAIFVSDDYAGFIIGSDCIRVGYWVKLSNPHISIIFCAIPELSPG